MAVTVQSDSRRRKDKLGPTHFLQIVTIIGLFGWLICVLDSFNSVGSKGLYNIGNEAVSHGAWLAIDHQQLGPMVVCSQSVIRSCRLLVETVSLLGGRP